MISVLLMFWDKRGGWLDTARYGLQAAIYPLQLAVNSPSAAWHWLEELHHGNPASRGGPAATSCATSADHTAEAALVQETPRCAGSTPRSRMSSKSG